MRNCTRIPDLTQRVGGANSHGGIAIVHPSQQEIKGSLPPITSKCPNRAPTNFNGLILQRSNKWLNDSTVVEMAKRCYRSCAHLRLCVGYGREQRLNGVRVAEQTEDIRRVRAHPVVRMMQCRGKGATADSPIACKASRAASVWKDWGLWVTRTWSSAQTARGSRYSPSASAAYRRKSRSAPLSTATCGSSALRSPSSPSATMASRRLPHSGSTRA